MMRSLLLSGTCCGTLGSSFFVSLYAGSLIQATYCQILNLGGTCSKHKAALLLFGLILPEDVIESPLVIPTLLCGKLWC